MLLRIDELKKGSKKTSKGASMSGLNVKGITLNDDGTWKRDWERFLFDAHNADEIATIEDIGVGEVVEIFMKKNGNYWNIDGAQAVALSAEAEQNYKAASAAGSNANPKVYDKPKSTITPETASEALSGIGTIFTDKESYTKKLALEYSVELAMAKLKAPERLKALFPSKITSGLFLDSVLDDASKIADFLSGKGLTTPKSDPSDLKEPVVTLDEATEIPDEDIPFSE